jgi:SpoVK/Ycf46/Vps4 family AAA+-type ATPase
LLEPVTLGRLGRLRDGVGRGAETFDFQDYASLDAKGLIRCRVEFKRLLKRFATIPSGDEGLERNALFARDEFGLDDIDAQLLLLLLRYERNSDLEQFADEVLQRLHCPAAAVAALLGIDRREARRRVGIDGRLIGSGLVSVGESECTAGLAGQSGYLQLARPLRKVIHHSCASRQEWVNALVGEPLATPLTWDDFNHLGAVRELAAHVMTGAAKTEAKGVNLLLHGPAGTGKTEFAKALAFQVGMSIWSVGETDEQGDEPMRYERLAALKLAQRLLSKRADALILLDEAEDVLAPDMPLLGPVTERARSKVYVNRMIEQNTVPVIWTCNDTSEIDAAVLRRMTLAIEIRTPNQPVRARIWQRVLDDAGLKLEEGATERLSRRYRTPPAVAANAARAAMLAGGGEAEVEEAMGGVLQILGIAPRIVEADSSGFDPSLVNCDEDLAQLTGRLTRLGASRQWSLCLHGPPGTGKSQFARHLAARLDMEVMQQRASDLLSKWVGDSEKQIAAAFQAARARRAMLVIDEADSLLSDRREAVRSWEVTQVNEMLTWMESHPLPFVCTTNLMDRIDQASLRRFTLKLRFKPLKPIQAALAFERFFGIAAPRNLPDGLSPGDFTTVCRKRDLLGIADPSVLASWLDEEADAKGIRVQQIGFLAGRD